MAARILLVEDEVNIAEAIRFLLIRDGYEVAVVHDGGEAGPAIRAFRPDLVILDFMLPQKDGPAILGELRADPDPVLAGLPVLMLTAKGQSRDREAAMAVGASAFMTKPFSNADLRSAVRDLFAGAGG